MGCAKLALDLGKKEIEGATDLKPMKRLLYIVIEVSRTIVD